MKKTAGQGSTRGESAAGGRSRAERILRLSRRKFRQLGPSTREGERPGRVAVVSPASPSLPVGRAPEGWKGCAPAGVIHSVRQRSSGLCSVESGDALAHLFAEPVDEHLAWSALTGDHLGVLDRVLELRVGAEVFSTSIARPGAVFLFDHVEEGHGHALNTRRPQPHCQSQRSRLCPPVGFRVASRCPTRSEAIPPGPEWLSGQPLERR